MCLGNTIMLGKAEDNRKVGTSILSTKEVTVFTGSLFKFIGLL